MDNIIACDVETTKAFSYFMNNIDNDNFDINEACRILSKACQDYLIDDYDELRVFIEQWCEMTDRIEYKEQLLEVIQQ